MKPILEEIKVDDLISIKPEKNLEKIMSETSELFIRNTKFGVSIQNSGSSITLSSDSITNPEILSVCLKFNNQCNVSILGYRRVNSNITHLHKPILTDIIEIQFSGHLSGIVVPLNDKGVEVLKEKFKGVDISRSYGYKMSTFPYNLNTHQAIIQNY